MASVPSSVDSCPACQGQEGAQHTCAGSGVWLGQEGHGSDAVDVIHELPRFAVTIHSVIRGVDEGQVREKVTGLMRTLLDDDLVDWVDFAVEERP